MAWLWAWRRLCGWAWNVKLIVNYLEFSGKYIIFAFIFGNKRKPPNNRVENAGFISMFEFIVVNSNSAKFKSQIMASAIAMIRVIK